MCYVHAMKYEPVIGLEIHAELKTKTKMFCYSLNDPHEQHPTVNICSVCMGHPGTLPVINEEAVKKVILAGLALNGRIAEFSQFDRKNYFYPDLPKGYQISQYQYPLVQGGRLDALQGEKMIRIQRIHLEEDTGRLIHDPDTGSSLVDFNRAGVPLMELVTEPDFRSGEEVRTFGEELQRILRYIGVSDADMEKGQMRVEVNISLRPEGREEFGTKVEVKNINSFRAMERAVEYEIKRQRKVLESGEAVVQETRGWDDAKQATFSQRVKEGSADYRYFPDPDLPSLRISEIQEFSKNNLQKSLPELPEARRQRYISSGIKSEDADQFTAYPHLGAFMDAVTAGHSGDKEFIQRSANYIANDLVNLIRLRHGNGGQVRDADERDSEIKDISATSPEFFRKIMTMIGEDKVSSRAAKDLLLLTITEKKDPELLATDHKLIMHASVNLTSVIHEILAKNSGVVADYKKGKEAALQFLIGEGMRALKGAVDPSVLKKLILEKIS